jgi:hypothetical protein
MRVNSAGNGFFETWLLKSALVLVITLSTCSTALATCVPELGTSVKLTDGRNRVSRAKQVNLLIRFIGHKLLVQSGDFSSRVLPVTETKEGTFVLQFEKQFVFRHDSLIALAQEMFPKSQYPSGYTVTVLDCMSQMIIYGFQVRNTSPDLMACQGRSEPAGCYTIEFNFPDFYKGIEEGFADVIRPVEKKTNNTNRAVRATTNAALTSSVRDLDYLASELKTFKAVAPPEVKSPEMPTAKSFKSTLLKLLPTGMLVLLGVTLVVSRLRKKQSSLVTPNQIQVVAEQSDPNLSVLGKFSLDVKHQRLVLGNEVFSLTEKECKILELFNHSFGELVPRETLMQKVWIDEGVITGRSLDMFVSKLRKKLSSDPELKITNVHGKGYKLEKVSSI